MSKTKKKKKVSKKKIIKKETVKKKSIRKKKIEPKLPVEVKVMETAKTKRPSSKQRTLREITNLIKRLRDMKAVNIKVGDIECTFLPEETPQAKKITETINNHLNKSKDRVDALVPADKEFKDPVDDDDPDLFDDGF